MGKYLFPAFVASLVFIIILILGLFHKRKGQSKHNN